MKICVLCRFVVKMNDDDVTEKVVPAWYVLNVASHFSMGSITKTRNYECMNCYSFSLGPNQVRN